MPRLAVLTDPDDKVRAFAAFLVAIVRQCNGEILISRDLIGSSHAGHVLELLNGDDASPFVTLRVVTLPPDMVQGLADATRAIAADVGDHDHDDPEGETFLQVPRDIIRG